eukprot:403243-Pyramimonas_sp.AAC.1
MASGSCAVLELDKYRKPVVLAFHIQAAKPALHVASQWLDARSVLLAGAPAALIKNIKQRIKTTEQHTTRREEETGGRGGT